MRIVLSITGASGSIYALHLIKAIQKITEPKIKLILLASDIAIQVFKFETGYSIKNLAKELDIPFYKEKQFFAPIASGTFNFHAHIIIPCTMGTLARIAHGISSNLIERTADVSLKEKRILILSIRESPLNSIHLRNMLTMSEFEKCYIVPPLIAFYNKPQSIESIINFHIGKIFNILNLSHSFFEEWGN